jgi:hypothetical protein
VFNTDLREVFDDVKGRWTRACDENNLEKFSDEEGT